MKKSRLFLLLFVSFFINVDAMYSSVETYYALKMNKVADDDDWNEVEIMILSGGNPSKPRVIEDNASTIENARTMSIISVASAVLPISVQPISLYQNDSYLKVDITLDEKINIKVLNARTDLPIYMRQYVPGGSNEMMINTSKWSGGYYNVIFTNSSGEVVAKGTIYIN